jgi:hypothetical protein
MTVAPDQLLALFDRGRKLEKEFRLYLAELEALVLERREKLGRAVVMDPRTGKPYKKKSEQ